MITKRQQEILTFIKDYHKSNGFSPSYNDIAKFFGITPPTAFNHVSALERNNMVTVVRGERRSIMPVKRVAS